MLGFVVFACLLLNVQGRPNRYNNNDYVRRRYRRDVNDVDVNGVVYAPCKDTYSQCGEWKRSGMCEMPQYKDYMPLVCTDACGFCKANKQTDAVADAPAPKDVQETSKIEAAAAPVDPGLAKDKIQEDYEEQLKKYYTNLAKQQEEYQASIAPAKTEAATANSGVPAVTDVTATPEVASVAPGPPPAVVAPPVAAAYNPYQAAYPSTAQPAADDSTKSSTSIGSSSSSTSGSSTDTSVGASVGTLTDSASGNATAVEGASAIPSKVAPETPSLSGLPPLLALPPISESLLEDEGKNGTASVEKETSDLSETDKQEADSKPYVPEQTNSTATATPSSEVKKTESEAKKEEVKEVKEKPKAAEEVADENDRKVTTENQETNEMTKSESKHLTASAREHKKPEEETNEAESEDEEEEDDDDGKEGDDKAGAEAAPAQPAPKASREKEESTTDTDDAKKKSGAEESGEENETGEEEEGDDDVYKHDEKSGSEGEGSSGAGLEESSEGGDLNYITDFHPDDFNMDMTNTRQRDNEERLHQRNTILRFPKNHPLFSLRTGISKARSDIVARNAPHIIDATEDGVGDSPLLDGKVKLAHLSKKEEIEESSGAPTEVDSKFFESKKGDDEDDDADDDNDDEEAGSDAEAEDAAKKSNLDKKKKKTESSKRKTKIESVKKAIKKSRGAAADPKPTIGMKSKINVNFKKSGMKEEEKKEEKKEELSDTAAKRKEILTSDEEEKEADEDATIADLSGGGSGDDDIDELSGDSRTLDEEDEEEDDTKPEMHDPEMADLKPKERKAQPSLNDFPDKEESKSSFSDKSEEEEKEKETDKEDADKKSSDDTTELDDIKIEELLNPKTEKKKEKKKAATKEKASEANMQEGKISLVLQQNFNVLYENKESPSYNMLAGNIKKDVEKTVPGTKVHDVSFSEVSVEGNPRQSGKTKANFNVKASTNEWMKQLLKLVDNGDIDGLRVIKGSLEIEEE